MSQILCRRLILSVFTVFAFCARVQATKISGTISTTLTVYDDSELVGDVKCMVAGNPCIDFGASGIKLRLNGFTITENITGCTSATSSQDGIDVGDVVSLHDVAIFGPGLVQKFGGFGIGIFGSSKVRVEGVTTSDNCFSGIILVGTTDSDIERNVSVRNSMGSEGAPCGGT
jgi:parallel beta helix pectate lyase-like protein